MEKEMQELIRGEMIEAIKITDFSKFEFTDGEVKINFIQIFSENSLKDKVRFSKKTNKKMKILSEKSYKELMFNKVQIEAIRSFFLKNRDCKDYVATSKQLKAFQLNPGCTASAIIGVMEEAFKNKPND
jgi:hypothetical protein